MIERIRRLMDTGNAVRFLLSFILAFALWAWVTVERDPEQTFRASNVTVVPRDVPSSLKVVGSPPEVDITLQGPRSVIQNLDTGSITAFADLSEVDEPGEHEVDVEVEAPEGIRRISVEPDPITIRLDEVTTASMQLEVPRPEVPPGLNLTHLEAQPDEVEVRGVRSAVERVDKVIVPIEIGDRTESFTEEVEPVPVDANNQPIEDVDVEPQIVNVGVGLQIRGKEVPVFVQWNGDAAEGFSVVGQPQPLPSTAIVDGPAEQLENVQFVYTVPIDTSELTQTTVFDNVQLDVASLPEGVTVEPSNVSVSVRVEQAEMSRTLESVPVQVLNVASGTRVVVNPTTLSITVEGPQEVISQLNERDIGLVVDVTGLEPGVHQLRPLAVLPPEVEYSEPPAEVVVGVTAVEPTPVPTPVPAPTATPTATAQP